MYVCVHLCSVCVHLCICMHFDDSFTSLSAAKSFIQTQSAIWLVSLARFSQGFLISTFRGWDYQGATTPIWHLHGFWSPELQNSCLSPKNVTLLDEKIIIKPITLYNKCMFNNQKKKKKQHSEEVVKFLGRWIMWQGDRHTVMPS